MRSCVPELNHTTHIASGQNPPLLAESNRSDRWARAAKVDTGCGLFVELPETDHSMRTSHGHEVALLAECHGGYLFVTGWKPGDLPAGGGGSQDHFTFLARCRCRQQPPVRAEGHRVGHA